MKKISLMIAAFITVHLVLAWLFWASGYDFDRRGPALGIFAYIGTCGGFLASFAIFLFYEEKK